MFFLREGRSCWKKRRGGEGRGRRKIRTLTFYLRAAQPASNMCLGDVSHSERRRARNEGRQHFKKEKEKWRQAKGGSRALHLFVL